MYSECNTGNANSGINDDPAMGQHGMQDCAFEIDDGGRKIVCCLVAAYCSILMFRKDTGAVAWLCRSVVCSLQLSSGIQPALKFCDNHVLRRCN